MKHKKLKRILSLLLSTLIVFSSSIQSFAEESADSWTKVASLSTPRAFEKAQIQVVNNKIYVMGGKSWQDGGNVVEEYDPDTNQWTLKAPMLKNKTNFCTEVVNGKIYAAGAGQKAIEEYDPQKNTWTEKAPMPNAATYTNLVVLNEKIYGISNGSAGFVAEYDPKNNTWTSKTPINLRGYSLATKIFDGKIYAIQKAINGKVSVYDPEKDTWTLKSPTNLKQQLFQVEQYNGKFYIIGGTTETGNAVSDVQVYDPITDTWETKSRMHSGRYAFETFSTNGKIYAIGGELGNIPLSSIEEYDIASDTWIIKNDFPEPLMFHKKAIANNQLYIFAAKSSTDAASNVYKYNFLQSSPKLTVTATPKKVHLGETFTTSIDIHNVNNIFAEDIKLTYDNTKFEYLGAEGQAGIKIYKEDKSEAGSLRFIIASQGKNNGATGDKGLIKLTFKAIGKGTGDVDIVKGRIADNSTLEEDVLEENCGIDSVTVEGADDVNRSGSYTLLDLGIDAYYFGDNAADTDSSKYDTDVVENGKIDDDDLSEITKRILSNSEYPFNS